MKEQYRLEVRKELDKLEMTCSDMASLLCGLGIHVGGGFYPSANEVSCLPSIIFQFSFVCRKQCFIFLSCESE